jgi:Zn-dependent M16 (insulinase) family peptidase
LARLLTCKFLHQEIREKGGAYGGGATQGNGLFQFYSYRDPNSVETLDVYNRSVEWTMDGSFTEQDVDETKLSVFAQIDAPVSPGSKGMNVFIHGITNELRQQYRQRLFSVTRQTLIETAQRYLDGRTTSSAIVGPHNEATTNNSDWNVIGDIREALS